MTRCGALTRRVLRLGVLGALLASGCSGAHDWLMGDGARITSPPQLTAQQLEATRKAFDPTSPRMTALLVMGAKGSEVTDLLAPYGILAASGAFDVFTVAARGHALPITGALAGVPDFTIANAPPADLIVVPAVAAPDELELQGWLQQRAPETKLVLSICEGARLVAAAGLMDGRRATTHFFALNALQKRHPAVRFLPGYRYVHDGNLVSSAGVSAALDATLYVIEQLADRSTAQFAASEIGYDWIEEDDPTAATPRAPSREIDAGDAFRLLRNTTLHRRSQRAGVLLFEGVSEVGLAGLVDTLPRTLTIWLDTVANARAPLRSQHGMSLIASNDALSLGDIDLLVVPPGRGAAAALAQPAMANAIAATGAAIEDLSALKSSRSIAAGLAIIARHSHPDDAPLVAKLIEHPYERQPVLR